MGAGRGRALPMGRDRVVLFLAALSCVWRCVALGASLGQAGFVEAAPRFFPSAVKLCLDS